MISSTALPSLSAKNEKINNRVNSRENILEAFLRKYVTLKVAKIPDRHFGLIWFSSIFFFIDDKVNVEVEVHWVTLLNKYPSVID